MLNIMDYICHISKSFVFKASKDSLHNICVPSVFVFIWRKTAVCRRCHMFNQQSVLYSTTDFMTLSTLQLTFRSAVRFPKTKRRDFYIYQAHET